MWIRYPSGLSNQGNDFMWCSIRERFLRECDLTLSKAVSAGHDAEETRKHARKILRSQLIADIDKIVM